VTKLLSDRARKAGGPAVPGICLALALAAGGCGGSSDSSSTSTAAQAPAATQTTAPKPVVVPAAHVSILSPRSGSHTGSTVTVSVAVNGASTGSSRRLHYVLDHRFTRSGSAHLTFHDVAPGRHHLDVRLASGASGRASTTFVVRAPAPVAVAAPAPVQHATTAAEPQRPTTPTPTRTPPPPPARTNPSPPRTTTTTPTAPPAAGGIPQGGGGDGDGDNSGGPSDGDGNL
jgi:hypothetical protein